MNTKLRKSLLIGLCAASLGSISVPMTASAGVGVYIDVPTCHRFCVERVPAPRAGYLWAPGYWDVRSNHHVWRTGHWEHERRGYHYASPAWVQHENRWELQRGGWSRGDRDGDGVPNAVDRAPDNPNRH